MWGPLQLKPPTDHPVSNVGTQPIQRLSCGIGWRSMLLKPLCFSAQPPLYTPPELLKDLYVPLCVYREGAFPESSSNEKGPMMPCVLIATQAVHVTEWRGRGRTMSEAGFPSRHCSSNRHTQRGRNVLHPKTKCQSEGQACR